ncbi:MAG: hemolysin family protein [Bacteroidetes bacterium]|nr:hemolysin family protein [Bacteroidota bacterium]MDA0873450.1 hemolysin family protein [Bacteroidota bacterium]
MEIALILISLVLSAFFSGSEIAFVSANRLRVEVFARRGGLVGRWVSEFLEQPATLLTTTLVGNNLALVIYSTLVALYLEAPLKLFFGELLGMSGAADILALAAQTVVASVVVLLIGEVLPKSVMREIANRAVFWLAFPLRMTYYLLLPLILISRWTASALMKAVRIDSNSFSEFIRRDFELLIEESKRTGELDLDEEESTLVSNVFAMGTIKVRESMMPRTNMIALEESASLEEAQELFVSTGHSKIPIYRENIDNIVGVAFAYDLFSEPKSLSDMLRPATFVPETKLSKELLKEFLQTNTSIAIVIDEYGGTAGLVTSEDLLEEIFGDIRDEFDVEENMIRILSDEAVIASGRLDVDELAEETSIKLPDGDFETVAGYLLERLGTIPKVRDEFELDGYRFLVLRATANRIDLVRISRLTTDAGPITPA